MNDESSHLDTCSCCGAEQHPEAHNLPQQPALRYRTGTHAAFLNRMRQALPKISLRSGSADETRPLTELRTRSTEDPSIALLDASALVGDILSFYQERIANEGYLRTAREQRSVLELARAIGYELAPGVSAATHLAFTLDEPFIPPIPGVPTNPGPAGTPLLPVPAVALPSPERVPLPAGIKVQSMPSGSELPQVFETAEDIVARVSFNALRPRATRRPVLQIGAAGLEELDSVGAPARPCNTLYFAGTSSNLRSGDVLVIQVNTKHLIADDPLAALAKSGVLVATINEVETDFQNQRTRVTLDTPSAVPAPPHFRPATLPDGAVDETQQAQTLENVRARVFSSAWDESELQAFINVQRWDAAKLLQQLATLRTSAPPPATVHVLRTRVGMFGNSAPPYSSIKAGFGGTNNPWKDWENATILASGFDLATASTYVARFGVDVFLDRVMSSIAVGSLVVLMAPNTAPKPFVVKKVVEATVADFAIAGKATGLSLEPLSGTKNLSSFSMRTASALVQSEPLELALVPIDDPVWSDTHEPVASIELDRTVFHLRAGQKVLLSGITVDQAGKATGASASELRTLQQIIHGNGRTTLAFTQALEHSYDRLSLTLNANVALATHGETAAPEILGSGNGAEAFQRFALKRAPLTHISAPTPSGEQSTLTIRVSGVEWSYVASLYEADASSQVYTLRRDQDGTTWVVFGDGKHGARLPTGQNNVVATYRTGSGPAGEVQAGALSLLQSKPLGLKAVTNPLPATGAAAPEQLEDARSNAPRTVVTLDRIVSLRDYEAFARGFSGVGKAQATLVWGGQSRKVHLSVASATGGLVEPGSTLYENLRDAIRRSSDNAHDVVIASYEPRFFELELQLFIDPRFVANDVLSEVASTVEQAFTFERRNLGDPVTDSEILALVQPIEGVVAARVARLHFTGQAPSNENALLAELAIWNPVTESIRPSQLLLLKPGGLALRALES